MIRLTISALITIFVTDSIDGERCTSIGGGWLGGPLCCVWISEDYKFGLWYDWSCPRQCILERSSRGPQPCAAFSDATLVARHSEDPIEVVPETARHSEDRIEIVPEILLMFRVKPYDTIFIGWTQHSNIVVFLLKSLCRCSGLDYWLDAAHIWWKSLSWASSLGWTRRRPWRGAASIQGLGLSDPGPKNLC
jgi:hypothetical protein